MIRVAAGETLQFAQKDIVLDGWAIESRIYAEDPYRNFLPSTGRLVRYRPPEEGTREHGLTVRNDTGVYEGGEISVYYDPMIAKLCTHGPTREAAIEHMADALDAFYVDGIQHNIPFLAAIMQHPRWIEGRLTTGFIAEEFPDGFGGAEASDELRRRLVAVAAAVDLVDNERKRLISGQMGGRAVKFARRRAVEALGQTSIIELVDDGPFLRIAHVGEGRGHETIVDTKWLPGQPVWTGRIDGHQRSVQVRRMLNGYRLSHRGVEADIRVYTEREAELAALMPVKLPPDTSKMLLCPMPGLVVSIGVTEGQEVKTGETLAVVEAMKMENVLRAERDLVISKINAAPGDSLAVDAVIMEFA
jgi:propionyl-CoA carboxylase alpha chain